MLLTIITTCVFPSCEKSLLILHKEVIVKPKPKVVGYVNAWPCDIGKIQFDKLTHINYAFGLPTPTGGLKPIEDPANFKNLIIEAHLNKVKVIFSVGGWNGGDVSAFESISENPTYRKNFINTLNDLLVQYDLDGIDIDWEAPIVGKTDVAYCLLIKQLSESLHKKNKLLTIAAPASNAAFIKDDILKDIDFFNIMAYDNVNEPNHSSYNHAESALNYWLKRGVSPEKAILGIPFYGRTLLNYQFLSYDLYYQILEQGGLPDADVFNRLEYNGISTVKRKTTLALEKGGGVMIWELGGDTDDKNSLLTAINEIIISHE